jgi:Arc/MetJ family transcription regulator
MELSWRKTKTTKQCPKIGWPCLIPFKKYFVNDNKTSISVWSMHAKLEKIMRATLDIVAELLEEVVKATGARTKKKAIEIAIKEFLRAKRREELNELIGNYEEFNLTLEELERIRIDS